MSNPVMDQCWPLQMPPTPKAVLVSLADNADDTGYCWPSIPKICERTCFSERAVHRAIAWLEAHGALAADRSNGRHSRYCVTPNCYEPPHMRHPRSSDATADMAPAPPQMRQQPPQMRQQPPPQVRSNRKEPSRTVSKATQKKSAPACAVARPDGVQEQTWNDWLTLRKAKKAPVTETVVNSAIAEAALAGLSLERFLAVWCARGSQGLQADWLKPHERAGPGGAPAKPSAAADFRGKTYESTPIDQLPPDLREAARAALADG